MYKRKAARRSPLAESNERLGALSTKTDRDEVCKRDRIGPLPRAQKRVAV